MRASDDDPTERPDPRLTIGQARSAAGAWVRDIAGSQPGFAGAFLHGSSLASPDAALVPPTSDLDLVVAVDGAWAGPAGKLVHRGALLDVSTLPLSRFASAESVLSDYRLAGSFWGNGIVADPTGQLANVHAVVGPAFSRIQWVSRRIEDAKANVAHHLEAVASNETAPARVTGWLFGAGVTTHMLLVAGLENPTVRRRYETARDLLADYGADEVHEELLALLGCQAMRAADVERHLNALEAAFDAARAVIRSPFFFAADISRLGRPIAIDGSREMIARGSHREAVFWIAATFLRCLSIVEVDAPELSARVASDAWALLGDLGLHAPDDLPARADQVRAFLPRVDAIARAIAAANPRVVP